jgi:hypothetical protein
MHADRFRADVLANRNNRAILDRWNRLDLPDCWLVAGCLFQTVWNLQAGRAPEENIKDYDLFYYDNGDLGEEAELDIQKRVDEIFVDLGVTIEVANQARVHTWYESHFGHPYQALNNASEGIDRFLIPATCVGVCPTEIYAPNGLAALYEGVLTENPLTPYPDLFDQKAASYRSRWPFLRVVRTPNEEF